VDSQYLHAIDSQTEQEKWKFQTDTDIIASPTVAAGVIYFGILDAYLYAVQ
jgi:outer membrane protein assembly factor BamB